MYSELDPFIHSQIILTTITTSRAFTVELVKTPSCVGKAVGIWINSMHYVLFRAKERMSHVYKVWVLFKWLKLIKLTMYTAIRQVVCIYSVCIWWRKLLFVFCGKNMKKKINKWMNQYITRLTVAHCDIELMISCTLTISHIPFGISRSFPDINSTYRVQKNGDRFLHACYSIFIIFQRTG